MIRQRKTLKTPGGYPPWYPAYCQLLGETIAAWAEKASVNLQEITGGWRVVISYNGAEVTFDYTVPDGFENKPISKARAVSAAWAMTGIARNNRPVKKFSAFFRQPDVDAAMEAKYSLWTDIAQNCVKVFGPDFGLDEVLKAQAKNSARAEYSEEPADALPTGD